MNAIGKTSSWVKKRRKTSKQLKLKLKVKEKKKKSIFCCFCMPQTFHFTQFHLWCSAIFPLLFLFLFLFVFIIMCVLFVVVFFLKKWTNICNPVLCSHWSEHWKHRAIKLLGFSPSNYRLSEQRTKFVFFSQIKKTTTTTKNNKK
jgi:hypothetical protein